MKILIIIPSKGRPIQLKALTGDWLFKSGIDYKILIEPQDMNAYWEFENILQLPENDMGMEYAQLQGKLYAEQHGYDVIFKIDDDIEGWTTMNKKDKKSNTNRFLQIIKDIEKPLEKDEIVGISFGYRQEFWHDKTWFGINQRFQSCYVVKTKYYQPYLYQYNGKGMWEDMINFLRVIKDGHKVLRYGKYQMDTRVESGMEGGLTDWYKQRNLEQYKQTLEGFKKEFPWMTFRQKKNGRLEPAMDNPAIAGVKIK